MVLTIDGYIERASGNMTANGFFERVNQPDKQVFHSVTFRNLWMGDQKINITGSFFPAAVTAGNDSFCPR